MHVTPTLAEALRFAEEGSYRVLPVSCEILSDFITPIQALQILKNVSGHCFLLESALASEHWGRYTFLGFDPKLEITCLNGRMRVGSLTFETKDPSGVLRQILSEHKSPQISGLPDFTGGLVGYFSYRHRHPEGRRLRGDAGMDPPH